VKEWGSSVQLTSRLDGRRTFSPDYLVARLHFAQTAERIPKHEERERNRQLRKKKGESSAHCLLLPWRKRSRLASLLAAQEIEERAKKVYMESQFT